MTPQEKAKELHHKYCTMMSHCDDAVECALIAVDEILKIEAINNAAYEMYAVKSFWKDVKREIEKL